MRIIFDNIIFSLQRGGGGSVYWLELISRFVRDSKNHCSFIEYGDFSKNYLLKEFKISGPISYKQIQLHPILMRMLPVQLPEACDIFHSSYYRIPNRGEHKSVVTVHDFTTEKFGTWAQRKFNLFQKQRVLREATGVICISENTRKDLYSFFPWIEKKLVCVIPNGVSEQFMPLNQLQGENYSFKNLENIKLILFVGGRQGYKNFLSAVKTVKILREHDHSYTLGVVGSPLTSEESSLVENAKIPIVHFNNVKTSELNEIYNRSFCLLYPSQYEGFGIPILEAMRAGCPVVAANCSSIPEVCGQAALLIDNFEDNEAYTKQILSLENFTFRNQLIGKGLKHAQLFSWENTYKLTHEFYEKIMKYRRGQE